MGKSVDVARLPDRWPTNNAPQEFWSALGRVVATFGALEEVLAQVIFALTANKEHEQVTEEMFERWVRTLEKAVSGSLGKVIDLFEQTLRQEAEPAFSDWQELVADLRIAKDIRDVVCHGSWRRSKSPGKWKPFFVNRKLEAFDSEVDVAWLDQVQRHIAELIASCINCVTLKGIAFPGMSSAAPAPRR